MKKRKAVTKSSSKKKSSKPTVSNHPIQQHADKIRELVHSALAEAGIHDVSLRSMEFGGAPDCPDGYHAEQTCTRNDDGSQTCTWHCVQN